ncbi:MAG TPA: TonB-dependent receptor, partial [Steroidobacteraceae bacterium]|nr:TonB-dependent receptor [Steroidobacteraceae bacterium]
LPAMSTTLDVYQINVTNRIVGTGTINGTVNGVPTAAAPVVDAAIAANGNQLDPVVVATGSTGVEVFANGIDTQTRGADLVFEFPVDYDLGHVNYSLAATYTDTALTRNPPIPPQFAGQLFYDPRAISDLTTAFPKFVINLGANWTYQKLSVSVAEKLYGPSSEYDSDQGNNPTGVPVFFKSSIGTVPITNLNVGYQFTKLIRFDIGALNLFDRFPPRLNDAMISRDFAHSSSYAVQVNPIWSPFGINGGYYYAKATLTF